jgi:type IV pilus assembly protein PilO
MESTDLSNQSKLASFFEKLEQLTKVQRILISVGIFVLIIGVAGWYFYRPKFTDIRKFEDKLGKIEKQLHAAKRNAATLDKFKAEMKEAEAQFQLAMQALPEKEEIPSLLTSISKSGNDAGLHFLLFEPKPEVIKEFYAEIPVAINVKGTYHNLAIFFDKVARLSRIVNVRDITMGQAKEGIVLDATCTAVTYKFVEPAPKPKAAPKKKRRKKKRK